MASWLKTAFYSNFFRFSIVRLPVFVVSMGSAARARLVSSMVSRTSSNFFDNFPMFRMFLTGFPPFPFFPFASAPQ